MNVDPGGAASREGPAAPQAAGRGEATRAQIRGSSLLLAGQAFALVVNLAVQVLMVRYLAKSDFGVFAYALAVLAIGQAVAAFGLRRGVSRFMSIYEERGEIGKAAGTLVFAVGTVLSLGLAVVLVVVGLRGLIAGSVNGGDALAVLAIMIVLAPVQAVGELLDGTFAVFTRPRAILVRRFILGPLIRLAVVGLLVLTESGVVFLAWGYLASGVLGLVIYVPMLVPMLRQRGFSKHMGPRRLDLPVREILRFTVPLLSNDLVHAATNAAGAIIVGALASAQDVADLRAVFPVVHAMSYVLTSFGHLFVPLASRLYVRGDAAELNRLYWQTTVWTTLLAYPIFVTAVVLAEPLTVLLFGERYESAAPILAVLALGYFANTAVGHNGVLLTVFGRVRYVALTNVLSLAVILALMFALVPAYGALGAAIATSATYLVLNAVRQAGIRTRTTVRAVHPRYAVAWVWAAGLTGVALATELALSPPVAVEITIAALAWLVLLGTTRRRLRLRQTFPELERVAVFRLALRAWDAARRRAS